MQTVMIVGAGKGGMAIIQIIQDSIVLDVQAVVDIKADAPGLKWAKKRGIQTNSDWRPFIKRKVDLIIEATGNEDVYRELRQACSRETVVISSSVAYMLVKLFKDKEKLTSRAQKEIDKYNLIFNSINDGMIVINNDENIVLFNQSAEKLTGIHKSDALGKHISQVVPMSELPRVLRTREIESNQEVELSSGLKVIATRIPIIDNNEILIGGLSIFKKLSEAVSMAEEITDLKEVQTKLQAICYASDEAISIVDEDGIGIMINPAYTRITGLTKEQVLGKPATTDIAVGESVHMKVLKTRREVKGVPMQVGPNKKEVVVNGAPVIVNGKLKGSVGIIRDVSQLKSLDRELNRAKQMIRILEAKYSFEDIIGHSAAMKIVIEQAKLAATTPATILLRGEPGTGKELFAHAIHNGSNRKFNRFIRVNCASLSKPLLERELFGYVEGAFVGAKRGGKKGLFEEANNGSIFLNEVGELPLNIQEKLLRVLQDNEITRVGGTKAIALNVRVIAATNVNLEKAMANGEFHEDLYYRLNQMPIFIPPLRKRKEDIELLCYRLIERINQEYGRNVEGITENAFSRLLMYDWPGNIWELDNMIRRAIIFMAYSEKKIDLEHLFQLGNSVPADAISTLDIRSEGTLSERLEEYEKWIIEKTLEKNSGNKTKSAKELGLSIRNLYYKLEKYNLASSSVK